MSADFLTQDQIDAQFAAGLPLLLLPLPVDIDDWSEDEVVELPLGVFDWTGRE